MCLYLKELIKHKATSNIYVWKALVSFPIIIAPLYLNVIIH